MKNISGEMTKDSFAIMKGLAIIAVILSHLPRIVSLPIGIESMLHPLGYFGVAVFLVLSGFGCTSSINCGGSYHIRFFWKKRIIKIIPSLAIVITLTVIIKELFFDDTWALWEIMLNAVGLSCTIGRVTWYIMFQILCYILLTIIGTHKDAKTVVLYVVSSCVILVFTIIFDIVPLGTSMWGLNAFSFQIGVLWAIYSKEIKGWLEKMNIRKHIRNFTVLAIIFFSMFILCYFILDNPKECYLQNPFKSLMAGIVSVGSLYCTFLISKYGDKLALIFRGVKVLGDYSYELFLVHGIVLFQFSSFFSKEKIIGVIVFIVITICVSVDMHLISRKIANQLLY